MSQIWLARTASSAENLQPNGWLDVAPERIMTYGSPSISAGTRGKVSGQTESSAIRIGDSLMTDLYQPASTKPAEAQITRNERLTRNLVNQDCAPKLCVQVGMTHVLVGAIFSLFSSLGHLEKPLRFWQDVSAPNLT